MAQEQVTALTTVGQDIFQSVARFSMGFLDGESNQISFLKKTF
jgi:hypothetical protein